VDDEGFADARKKVEELYTRMDNKTIRKVYAYYKQATEGDISGKRPSALRFRDRVKFDAWSSISGMSREDAKSAYIDLVNNLDLNDVEVSCEAREARASSE
jgi:diazepam-binding inhibitor (GABA receptor modulating acyl-CoA-binding protein)|tara:strand:+ start:608 stop:910 length:303 start_codon:yes stop_codon:yes gene_type:complete